MGDPRHGVGRDEPQRVLDRVQHRQRAKVPYGMELSLEMGEVIAGIAVLGAFGAEVSAGRGGQD